MLIDLLIIGYIPGFYFILFVEQIFVIVGSDFFEPFHKGQWIIMSRITVKFMATATKTNTVFKIPAQVIINAPDYMMTIEIIS